ncbi:MAG: hypothetical protein MHPSP_003081, partial [Paramarteilia canceri]
NCDLDGQIYNVGDFVYLYNDFTIESMKKTGRFVKNAYIVRILEFYSEFKKKSENNMCTVQWVWKKDEIITKNKVLAKSMMDNEIFLDGTFSFDPAVEISSIIGLCNVDVADKNGKIINEERKKYKYKTKYIVCRVYDGTQALFLDASLFREKIISYQSSNKDDHLVLNDLTNKEFDSPQKQEFKTPSKAYFTPRRTILTNHMNKMQIRSRSLSYYSPRKEDHNSFQNSNDEEQNSDTTEDIRSTVSDSSGKDLDTSFESDSLDYLLTTPEKAKLHKTSVKMRKPKTSDISFKQKRKSLRNSINVSNSEQFLDTVK